jgi:hypothetical protein
LDTQVLIVGAGPTGLSHLREGEFANRFYLIESGKVIIESGEGFGDPVVVEAW